MANETVLFKRGDSATITSTPVTDGQILFDTSGNGKMYLDNGTDRLEMGGAITVDASLSKTSTNAIQNKAVTGNILNSLAEVSAATQQNTIAGALALKEVNSSLTDLGGFKPVIDENTGEITGYKTTIGGADTVFPFNTTGKGDVYAFSGYRTYCDVTNAKTLKFNKPGTNNTVTIYGITSKTTPSSGTTLLEVGIYSTGFFTCDISEYDYIIVYALSTITDIEFS